MSLLESIAQTDQFIYKKLSLEIINNTIDKVFSKQKERENSFVIYTGLLGYITSEIYFYSAFISNFPNVVIQPVRRGKYSVVISVYSKSGLYKCYVDNLSRVQVKKGTVLLTTFDNITPEIFKFIKNHKNE